MRKYLSILFAALLAFQSCSSDSNKPIKTDVSGTVTGAQGMALIIPYGQSSENAIARIPVIDGKFSGSFNGIQNLAYQFVIWDKSSGQGIFTYFFPDKGGVKFTCDGNASTPVEYTANGPSNKSFLKERTEENSLFADKWAALDSKGVEMESAKTFLSERTYAIMEELQSEGLSADKRSKLLEEIGSMEKDSTLYSSEAISWLKDQDVLLKEQQAFRSNWIKNNPDIASFFLLYTEISSQLQDNQDVTYLSDIYNEVFKDKFPNHIYHSEIARLIR